MLLESLCQRNVGNKLNVKLKEDHPDVKDICIIIIENDIHSCVIPKL